MASVRQLFISAVNSENGALGRAIHADLERSDWKVRFQPNLTELSEPTLRKLDRHIQDCDCLLQLAGRESGSPPDEQSFVWLRDTYPDLGRRYPEVERFLHHRDDTLSVTQWEAWLALYHGISLLIVGPQDLVSDLTSDKLGQGPFQGDERQRRHLRLLWNNNKHKVRCEPYADTAALRAMLPETLRRLSVELDRQSGTSPKGFQWPAAMRLDAALVGTEFQGREWLVDRVERWVEAVGSKPLLMLAGFGMGKTTTAIELTRRWADRNVLAHFCQFNQDETLKPGLIVRNIAAQLRTAIPAYGQAIEHSRPLQRLLEQAEDRPTLALKDAVFDVLRGLPAQDLPDQCFLIVDGLDESLEITTAPGQGGAKSTTLVDLVVDRSIVVPPWFRIVITSRPLPRLEHEDIGRHFSILNIDEWAPTHSEEDVTLYLRSRVAAEPAIGRFLVDCGRKPEELARRLSQQSAGRLLLVRYVLDDIRDSRIEPGQFDQLPVHVGEFYSLTFRKRVTRAGLDLKQALDLLALVAELRAPLPASILARILTDTTEAQVLAVFEAFSGLLTRAADGAIDFTHWSLEEWLDNSGQSGYSTPREFCIDRESARRRLVGYCRQMAGLPLEQTGRFRPYLERYAVRLLVEHLEFASALELLASLRAALKHLRRPSLKDNPETRAVLEQNCPKQADLVIDRLGIRWREIDGLPGSKQKDPRAALGGIAPGDLRELLYEKAYQTGKYVPVIRALIECHWHEWQGIEEGMLADPEENDIVFRHDTGVAYAQAWQAASVRPDTTARVRLMDRIESMARSAEPDLREIAGYGLKYICERTERRTWWLPILPRLKDLARHYAHSDSPTDRMVAGEMLLALAVQGEAVTRWFADEDGRAPFWNTYWPNHRADINAMRALLGDVPPADDGDGPESLLRCREQELLARRLAGELQQSHLFRETPFGQAFAPLLEGPAAQQAHADAFDFPIVRTLAAALRGPDRDDVLKFIRYLMLHPLWNGTERGATLLASIVKRDPHRASLIEELAASAGSAWRILYGAIDASYGCGAVEQFKYGTFFKLLLLHGRNPSCRVRGICIDDLNGWIRDADPSSLEARLGDPDLVELIRYWLLEADDIWLIEYLHEMFNDLRQIHRWSDERIGSLIGEPALSRYLGGAGFHEDQVGAFIARVEQMRRAEWEGARRAPGAV